MSKQVVKCVGDPDANTVRFYPDDKTSEDLANFLNGLVNKAKAESRDSGEAERFDRLAKSVSDRELSRYYAERAKELKN